MNSDTERAIEEIRKKRWYREGTTLGEGGWAAVYQFASEWRVYVLNFPFFAQPDKITAENDDVAVSAFRSLYRTLSGCTITEKIVTHREVAFEEHQ